MSRHLNRLARIVALLSGVAAGDEAGARNPAESDDGDRATVILVGVYHAPGQLLHQAMSPAHVRAALAAIDPDVLCVESQPAWFSEGLYYRQTYEAEVVAVPWARAVGIPVRGVDWTGDLGFSWAERQRLARVEAERAALGGAVDPAAYGTGAVTASQLRVAEPDPACDFAHLNSDGFAAEQRRWQDEDRAVDGSPQQYMARRNGKIADQIAHAAREFPGSRIAVVIGAAHVGDLERIMPQRGLAIADLPVVQVSDDDLSDIDVAAMLAHAFDNDQGVTLPAARRQRLMQSLADAAVAPDTPADITILAAYLDARWRMMLSGQQAVSASAFEGLVERGRGVRFPYRGTSWRLHLDVSQAARLELGRLADLGGERERALAHYRALLDDLPAPVHDTGYHADFEFHARARNAVRVLLDRPFRAELAFPTRQPATATASAAAAATRSLPTELWKLHRARDWAALRAAVRTIDVETVHPAERIELDYHRAAISVGLGERERARQMVEALEARAAGLSEAHWLVRSLPSLRKRLDEG